MAQKNLLKKLKLRYRLLTDFVVFSIALPPILGMMLWASHIESTEGSFSSGPSGEVLLLTFLALTAANAFIVISIYRITLKRILKVTNEQFWLLSFCQWYPEHWYKNNAT